MEAEDFGLVDAVPRSIDEQQAGRSSWTAAGGTAPPLQPPRAAAPPTCKLSGAKRPHGASEAPRAVRHRRSAARACHGSPPHSQGSNSSQPETDSGSDGDGGSGGIRQPARRGKPRRGAGEEAQRGRNTSTFRGVCWSKKSRRWQAALYVDSRYVYLGQYEDEHEAARMYDLAAITTQGARARLNFAAQDYCDGGGCVVHSAKLDLILLAHEQRTTVHRMTREHARALAGVVPAAAAATAAAAAPPAGGVGAPRGGGRPRQRLCFAPRARNASARDPAACDAATRLNELLTQPGGLFSGLPAQAQASEPAPGLVPRLSGSGSADSQLSVQTSHLLLAGALGQRQQQLLTFQEQQASTQLSGLLAGLLMPAATAALAAPLRGQAQVQEIPSVRPALPGRPAAQPASSCVQQLACMRPPPQSTTRPGTPPPAAAPGWPAAGLAAPPVQPPAAGAVPAAPCGPAISVRWLLQHVPEGYHLEHILPAVSGMCGMLCCSHGAGRTSWYAAVWDGAAWHVVGVYGSEQDASDACEFVMDAGNCSDTSDSEGGEEGEKGAA